MGHADDQVRNKAARQPDKTNVSDVVFKHYSTIPCTFLLIKYPSFTGALSHITSNCDVRI